MKDFINPKSMLTPGVAGSLIMFLVNGITFQFPEISTRYLALFLSFLIGAIVWFSETRGKSPALQKAVYWILNSLVIFVVGFGTANLAVDATAGASKTGTPQAQFLPFVSSAFAQGAQGAPTPKTPPSGPGRGQATTSVPSGPQSVKDLKEKLASEQAENLRLKKQLESMKQEKAVSKQPEGEKPFFKRW